VAVPPPARWIRSKPAARCCSERQREERNGQCFAWRSTACCRRKGAAKIWQEENERFEVPGCDAVAEPLGDAACSLPERR